jgi:hypothetical protein
MPTASYVKVAGSREALVEGINSGTDQWAIGLSNSVPSLAFTAGTTDLATGGGYTQGGNNVATTSSAEAAGTYSLILVDPTTWTATGGGFTARYALLINKTTNQVLGYWDYGSSQAVAAGETFVVDLDGTNGAIQLT